METIVKINELFNLFLPEGYTKAVLPGGKAWLEALRSGKYQQGFDELCNGKSHCCLGVLSDIQGRLKKVEVNDPRIIGLYVDSIGLYVDSDDVNKVIPLLHVFESKSHLVSYLNEDNVVSKVIGTNGEFPKGVSVKGPEGYVFGDFDQIEKLVATGSDDIIILSSLVACNDSKKLNFSDIAKIIELVWDCQ